MNNQRQDFAQLLRDLADTLELNNLELDQNDTAQIVLDGNVPINLVWKDEVGQVIAFAIVGYADDQLERRNELLQEILNAQFFWTKLRGLTLALEPETDLLVLMDKRQPAFFDDAEALLSYLETFAEVVQQWRRKLTEHAGDVVISQEDNDQEDVTQPPERFAALLGDWLQV